MSSWSNSARTWKSPSKGAILEDQVTQVSTLCIFLLVVGCWLFLGTIRDSKICYSCWSNLQWYLARLRDLVNGLYQAETSWKSNLGSDTRFRILNHALTTPNVTNVATLPGFLVGCFCSECLSLPLFYVQISFRYLTWILEQFAYVYLQNSRSWNLPEAWMHIKVRDYGWDCLIFGWYLGLIWC